MATKKEESAVQAREKRFRPLLQELGLPLHVADYDDNTAVSEREMPLKDFQKILKIKGVPVGTPYANTSACIAGSSVLAWVTNQYESNDYDYFPKSIYDAQRFYDHAVKPAGWQYKSFTGERGTVAQIMGSEWQPNPDRIEQWYGAGGLGNIHGGRLLPMEMLPPVLPASEMVRALNFAHEGNAKKLQIILCIRGLPSDVIETFDFSICQWAHDGTMIYWGEHTIQDMMRGRVRVVRIHHPMSTMRRMVKYSGRGYFFCNGTMLMIARAVAGYAAQREALGLDPLTDTVISVD